MSRKKGARLYQRPDTGDWIIREAGHSDERTGCRSERGSEPPERARRALARRLLGSIGEGPPRHSAEITCGEVLAVYARDRGRYIASRQTLANCLKALAPFWGDLPADSVKGATCRRYAVDRGVAASTSRRELGVLQAALNHAEREGIILHAPKVTLPAAGEPRDRWLTRGEVRALLRESPPHIRAFIIAALLTGTRRTTVLRTRLTPSLDSPWMDLDRGVWHRKGEREARTKKRRGAVAMPRALLLFARRLAARGQGHLVEWRGKPVGAIRHALERAAMRAGVSGVSPHVLKHTAVTWAFQRGMTLEDAVDYFSTSRQTLERVYRHHSPDHQKRAVEIMDRRR